MNGEIKASVLLNTLLKIQGINKFVNTKNNFQFQKLKKNRDLYYYKKYKHANSVDKEKKKVTNTKNKLKFGG